MITPGRRSERRVRSSFATWRRWIQIALPLTLGLVLIGVFVVLLLQRFQGSPGPVQAPPPEPAASRPVEEPNPVASMPRGSPTDPVTTPPAPSPPLPAGIKRWVIEPLPNGWDPELAAKLAELFGLVDFDPSDPDTFVAAGEAMEKLKELLASLGPEALPTLAAILNHEESYVLRRRLIEAIGFMGPETEASTFILLDYFKNRRGDLQARAEMNHVIRAMGELRNETSLGAMLDMFEAPDMPDYYRDKFIIELGNHPQGVEAKGVFLDTMLNSRDHGMANHSAQALGKEGIGSPEDLPSLYSAYERQKTRGHWMVRQTILGTIGKIGHESSLPFLEEEARYAKEDGVRLSAASAIRRIGSPSSRQILVDLSETDPDARVRGHILGWLQRP